MSTTNNNNNNNEEQQEVLLKMCCGEEIGANDYYDDSSDSDSDDDESSQHQISGISDYLSAVGDATRYEAIGQIKQLRQDLSLSRKNAMADLKMKKFRLRNIRKARRRQDAKRRERDQAKASIRRRARALMDLEDELDHEASVTKLRERFDHESVCRECAIEVQNREQKINTKYEVERAQKRAELSDTLYQQQCDVLELRHAIEMTRHHENIELARTRNELTQKYGAKMPSSIFE